ncbi:IS110 family transposase [Paucibacter sp. JuS9]|uniref:IS110 family transposase n=1 Tax=Paucibacter sp. JuS9 TaxID=3228748 RepID=UPI003757168E
MRTKLGVDISKRKFDVALLDAQGKFRSKVFANDAAGFSQLMDWIESHVQGGKSEAHACMEATGSYHEALAVFLHDSGVAVSVVNPLRVKRFIESEGIRNKTDNADAKALARFAHKHELELWEAPTLGLRRLQALVLRLQTLQDMRQAELNRLDVAHDSVRPSIQAMVDSLVGAIEEVTAQIKSSIDDDPDLRGRKELLQTIPGLGEKTIPQLLAYIGRPERFSSAKALVAYASLSPMIRQSGSSLNRSRGTHPTGHKELRQALFYPAMVAAKYNPPIAAFWARLKAQNKPGLVVVVACMHKLLAIAYGVLKSKKPFDPAHGTALAA